MWHVAGARHREHPVGGGRTRALDCRRPASADQISTLRRIVQDWARDAGLPADLVDEVTLATYEAMANVVEHAYPDNHIGPVDLHADIDGRAITVTVADQGRWQPPASDSGLRGRGLSLIEGLAGQASIIPSERGTTVRMRWPLS